LPWQSVHAKMTAVQKVKSRTSGENTQGKGWEHDQAENGSCIWQ
jgi:hypothetical protein